MGGDKASFTSVEQSMVWVKARGEELNKKMGEEWWEKDYKSCSIFVDAPDESVKKPLNVSLRLSVLSFSFAAAVKAPSASRSTETLVIVDGLILQSVKWERVRGSIALMYLYGVVYFVFVTCE